MATNTFIASPRTTGVRWNDPTVWAGGLVPNSPDADAVFPVIYQGNTNSTYYVSTITIANGEFFTLHSLSVARNFIEQLGTLAVTGSVDLAAGGELVGTGTTSAGSLTLESGAALSTSGQLLVAGKLDIAGNFGGGSLQVTAGALTVEAGGDLYGNVNLTVTGGSGAFTNLSNGVLTGGTYGGPGTLALNVGGTITTDAANLIFNGPRPTITTFDPSSGGYVPVEATLTTVAPTGMLDISNYSYSASHALTVAGTVTLGSSAVLSTTGLDVLPTGTVTGGGIINGPVVDDGTIASAAPFSLSSVTLNITGPVSGAGVLNIGAGQLNSGRAGIGFFGARSTLELGGAVSSNVSFTDASGTLILDDPADFTGIITPSSVNAVNQVNSIIAADAIVLTGQSISSVTGESYIGDANGGTLTIQEGGTVQTLRFVGNYATSSFALSAGPQALSTSPPTIKVTITALPAQPTLLLSNNGMATAAAITNNATPTVTGTTSSGTSVSVREGATVVGNGYAGYGVAGTGIVPYSGSITTPLTTGSHQLTGVATSAGGSATSTPLNLFVLPAPVIGITTADVASIDLKTLLMQGYSFQFIPGTQTVQLTNGTLSVGSDTTEAFLQRLYEGLLGRAGDPAGLGVWDTLLSQNGGDYNAISFGLLNSAEYQSRYGAPTGQTDQQFLTNLYQGFYSRAPDAAGMGYWQQVLAGGAPRQVVATAFAQSAEARMDFAAATTDVWAPSATGSLITQLYETGLGRVPDLPGEQGFTTALKAGLSPDLLTQSLINSPEFQALHAGQSSGALVASFYQSGLGRAPEAAGLQGYVNALQSGTSLATVLLTIATSPEASGHITPPI